ncbi:16S rRNA (uracil1498-N3)-methyltransferase [Bacilli bacterium PM5-9]|nr:16S rRNA (uracil1498-N3)-methyltransferase [Bacilli bacterium PM5-9]
MQQYMIKTNQIENEYIILDKDDLHHVFSVMRMKENDEILCVNIDDKKRYLCKIVNDKKIMIIEQLMMDNELDKSLVLAFGLVKADKLEFVIQKACELGVSKFIPLKTKNSIVKMDNDKINKKMVRWKKIIKEACEQAKRNTLMEIEEPLTIDDLKNNLQDINLVAYEKEDFKNKIRDNYSKDNSCLIIVGPEGGFDLSEVEKMKELNIKPISLGKRILRCETAAISVVSIISDLME